VGIQQPHELPAFKARRDEVGGSRVKKRRTVSTINQKRERPGTEVPGLS
jgi:hypothetical protein